MEKLKKEVERLAAILQATDDLLPTFGATRDFAHPHIEKHGNEYHYVVVERGSELKRQVTHEMDEILFWIFSEITFNMAKPLAYKHRFELGDPWIPVFRIQEELIGKIDKTYQEKLREKHRKVLDNK